MVFFCNIQKFQYHIPQLHLLHGDDGDGVHDGDLLHGHGGHDVRVHGHLLRHDDVYDARPHGRDCDDVHVHRDRDARVLHGHHLHDVLHYQMILIPESNLLTYLPVRNQISLYQEFHQHQFHHS